ncbi:hypothetical protein IFM89_009245 [Coptis chinensis]|uniref:UBA domain-containing protein n=1 Tax=Coptis chinensis TaxID=261450 RepID=A0A835I8N8_9MAGN|nr:hypothetical protein IFM89_009245 [Coptis chinensis]
MGFDRSQLTESLCSRVQNEATIAYYLLMDNRFRATSGYLGAEFQESMVVFKLFHGGTNMQSFHAAESFMQLCYCFFALVLTFCR